MTKYHHLRQGEQATKSPSYLQQLQRVLLQAVDFGSVSGAVERDGRQEILELNVVLPD